jgi:hypothetical protein
MLESISYYEMAFLRHLDRCYTEFLCEMNVCMCEGRWKVGSIGEL